MGAATSERDARARDEIGDGARNENFVGLGERLDALGDVDSDAADVVTAQLDFASVETATHTHADGMDRIAYGAGAAHGSSRPVEGRQKAVAGRFDFSAAEAFEFGAGEAVVGGEQLGPSAVAHPCDLVGGTHHVREHDGGDIDTRSQRPNQFANRASPTALGATIPSSSPVPHRSRRAASTASSSSSA